MSEQSASNSCIDVRLKTAQSHKTELKAKLLEWQLSPAYQRLDRIKTYSSASGLILASIAIIGGILSVFTWIADRTRERDLRAQERLDRILAGLSAPHVEQRVTSIAGLHYAIVESAPARNAQIVTSLTNALPLDKSSVARSTILTVFRSLDMRTTGQQPLNAGLASLALNSRVLMKESGLSEGLGTQDIWEKGLTSRHGAVLVDLADAITIFLRKGAKIKDLSGVYLAKQDLSGLTLDGMSFDVAILASANFSSAKLREASFAGSHLEGARFVAADLRKAKFNQAPRNTFMRPYIMRLRVLKPQGAGINSSVEMPDFSCADLQGADFSGHALFVFVESDAAKVIGYYHWPVRFQGANLSGVNLRGLDPFSVGPIKPFAGCCGGEGSKIKGNVFLDNYRPDDEAKLDDSMKNIPITANGIIKSFSGSNWKSASLPVWLREFLESQDVTETYKFDDGYPCEPLAPWGATSKRSPGEEVRRPG
jgi:uncharacterized protein YjbI with pentapeptide repeats